MQIALTKKLATAMKVSPSVGDKEVNPLFVWTANWTSTWDNRSAEDLLVLVNHATRFTVAIYQVKRTDLKNMEEKITEAIKNTLYTMHFNPEMVDAYMELAGEMTFVQSYGRTAAAWVSNAGRYSAFEVGNTYNGIEKMYNDMVGTPVNRLIVGNSGSYERGFYPYEKMGEALVELTGKTMYEYKALEILVVLNLSIYKATRRLIVPAYITFFQLHELLQKVFGWKNYHLYDFTVYQNDEDREVTRLVPFEEDLAYDDDAILIEKQTLSDFLTNKNDIVYRYDMGDDWHHHIQLIKQIDHHDQLSPYLVEANGQAPPEDVGGVSGFLEFHDIMLNEEDPEYIMMKKWAGFWSLELADWEKRPRLIHV